MPAAIHRRLSSRPHFFCRMTTALIIFRGKLCTWGDSL
jgi:hypothetical protein